MGKSGGSWCSDGLLEFGKAAGRAIIRRYGAGMERELISDDHIGCNTTIFQQPANIRFFTAMRVPPFGTGEDTRPDRAAIVAGAMDTILVMRVEDLPSAWAAIRTEAVLDTIHAHDIFLTLLEKTAVIQPAQIVRSADQLRNRYTLLDDTSSVQIIAPPSSRVEGGGIVSRLVTDQRAGVVQYEFVVDRAGRLQVRSQLLARYVTHM